MVQRSRSEVFRFIVGELQVALPYLSSSRSNLLGNYYGRITKPVVYFLLARLALNSEVYMDDNWTDQERPSGSTILFQVGKQT
ncbi:hypothetical protein AB9F41_36365, partial [Rhizobium leguminosarum]|uniref:hypothetical protein n=1 Tax=Rhizobium leguminosarum TaxID=384 RepID=UPI003F947732